jgi:hypothetical protein
MCLAISFSVTASILAQKLQNLKRRFHAKAQRTQRMLAGLKVCFVLMGSAFPSNLEAIGA